MMFYLRTTPKRGDSHSHTPTQGLFNGNMRNRDKNTATMWIS